MKRCLIFCAVLGALPTSISVAQTQPTLKAKIKAGEHQTVSADNPNHGISIDFPEPTDIRDVIRYYQLLSGKKVIVQEDIEMKISIVRPGLVPKEEGLAELLEEFRTAGLQVEAGDGVVRISKR